MSGFPSRRRHRVPLFLLCLALAVDSTTSRAQTPVPVPSATPAPGAPPDADDHRFVPPATLVRLPVAYPVLAHLNRVEGIVHVLYSIDENGNVTNAIVSRSSGSITLDNVVRDYNLRHWRFQPATFDGKPVPSSKQQDFEFRLDPNEEKALALKRLALPVGVPDAPYPKEALALRPSGSVSISVRWTRGGLVDQIALDKSSGSAFLDHAALNWAYENWHIDPATITDKNKADVFSKTMKFEPPPP